jgi:hypothetical protein
VREGFFRFKHSATNLNRKEIIVADYYTNFSFIMPLTNQAAQEYALDLYADALRVSRGDEPDEKLPASIQEAVEDWQFEATAEPGEGKMELWLHSDSGGIDAVCAFIQHLLQKFDPKGRVGFEWSHDCSKPRTDAYGGGAAFITAKKIKTMNTCDWLRRQNAARRPSSPTPD